ncbi:MAG: glycosyltransferase [Candidatus Omnitrophica bacterium]|nr:glycosyltransferase [Candidatus Omnitrophota bacterium]
MKILFVNRHIGLKGGVERYIRSLARDLSSRGYSTAIIHADGPAASPFGECYRLPDIWDKELELSARAKSAVNRVIGSFDPDLIFVHNLDNGKAIDHLAGRRSTVMYAHGYKAVDPDGKMLLHDPLEANREPLSLKCFLRAYTRKSMPRDPRKGIKAYLRAKRALDAARALDRVIVASKHMKAVMISNGIDPRHVTVLPCFTGRPDYPYADPEPGRVLFSGRITEGKGLEFLLDALGDVEEDYSLDIAGDGPLRGYCESVAEKRGLSSRVRFHGWMSVRQMDILYSKCPFLVMPSVWPEPFGIAGIEAAAHGRPAIAFDVGGISDWLKHGETGYLVKPYDRKEMARRITQLLRQPEKTRELGGRARERTFSRYSIDGHIRELLELFKHEKMS